VLGVARIGPASKYRIMCGAKLNFWQTESILSFLLVNGHLETVLGGKGFKQYTTTSKGERLRGFIDEIQDELDGLSIRAIRSHTYSAGDANESARGPPQSSALNHH